MDAGRNAVAHADDGVLAAMVELFDDQARVARAEAALAVARKREALSQLRLGRLRRAGGAVVPEGERTGAGTMRADTMRARIVATLEARRAEVMTPVAIADAVGASNRDSVRNTLLVLARCGRIEKVGVGRYRARDAAPTA